jgi:segregation and condensation protein B
LTFFFKGCRPDIFLQIENRTMEISQIIPHVESLIFAADRPLPTLEITDLLNNAMAFLEDRATLDQVETALEAVREKYSSEFYAFEVRESGGGYQFLTKKDYYQTVAQLNGEKFLKRLSTAALETLAIIAYKQPISKGEIEHIRGVATDYSIQKLLEKELIVITGRSEQLPGKPLIYGTSKAFMDYFGLNSPKDLPKLKEVFEEDVAPTLMLDLDANGNTIDEPLNMIVSETGELVEQIELPDGEQLSPVIAGVVSDETLERLDIDVPGGIEHVSVEDESAEDEPLAAAAAAAEEEETVSEDIIEAPEAIVDIEEVVVVEDSVEEEIVAEEIPEVVVASVDPEDEEDDEESEEDDEDDEDDDSEDEDDEEGEDDSDEDDDDSDEDEEDDEKEK